jgi:hypothetical protein
VNQPSQRRGDRMTELAMQRLPLRASLITLGVISVMVLACIGVWELPTAFDTSAAQALTQRYLTAISRADVGAATQAREQAEPVGIAQEVERWGGAEIRDLRFNALVRMSPSYGPVRMQEVSFVYRRPGQTTRAHGLLRMFWRFPDLTWWTIPSAEICDGSNGFNDP